MGAFLYGAGGGRDDGAVRAVAVAARAAATAEEIRWHSDFHDLPVRRPRVPARADGRVPATRVPQRVRLPAVPDARRLIASRPRPPRSAEEEIFGMPFPLDRFYHRGHTWARLEADGAVTVGLDELGKRLIGAPDAVDLPAPGVRIHANGTAFRVKKRDADVRVLSPVDGEVVETGGADRGWYLRVRPEQSRTCTHLLRGAEIRPWMMREMERLQLALSAEGAPRRWRTAACRWRISRRVIRRRIGTRSAARCSCTRKSELRPYIDMTSRPERLTAA